MRKPMKGLYYEQFEDGMVIDHPIRRTVTEMDNIMFSCLTHNPQPLHIDRHFAQTQTEFGKPLMNSLFTLGLMIGISVNDTTLGTTIGNLGMTEVKFPKPLFQGDTIHVRTTILGKRESKSRPDTGIVEFLHEAFNQDDVVVAVCKRQGMMRKRPAVS
jgi:acyl dehydratase